MDKALKQRLVGASVLVVFAVVVLPMLLGGRPEPGQESHSIELPPRPPELSFDTRRFPVGDQPPDQPSVMPESAQAATQADSKTPDLPVNEPTLPAVDAPMDLGTPAALPESGDEEPSAELAAPGPAPDGADFPRPTPPDTTVEGSRYLVQVASFSGTGNAERLSARLRAAGMPVLSDTVDTSAGRLHRVRVGPYADAAEAERAASAIDAEMPDLNPRVIDLRPDEMAPVSTPGDPLVRWVVQLGSFGDANNAESLVYRLRDAGFRASSEAVSGDSGTVYKVRVGPVVEREEAVRLAGRIAAETGLDGLVMSAD